jgi:PAS domain S-box-containing protein
MQKQRAGSEGNSSIETVLFSFKFRFIRLSGIYFLIGASWLLVFDWLLPKIALDAATLTQLQSLKSWVLLLVSAGIIGWLSKRSESKPPQNAAPGILSSIADRPQTEQCLSENEQFLRQIVDSAAENIWVVEQLEDGEFCIASMNRAIELVTDAPAEQWIGKRLDELWDSQIAACIRAHYHDCLQQGKVTYEEELPFKYQTRTFLTNLSLLPAQQGRTRLLGISMDITEQKQAEAALRHSEATTLALLNAIPDMIFRMDRAGIFLDFKPAKDFNALIPPEVFIGKTIAEVLPADIAQPALQKIEQALTSGEVQTHEYQMLQAGVLRSYESRIVSCSEHEVLAIVRDVSDREQAEMALRESEARFQAFMNHSPASAWITDAEGRMVYLSQTYLRMFQIPCEDVIGKSLFDLYPTEIAEQFISSIRTVAKTNQVLEVIELAPQPDGILGEFLVYKFPIPGLSEQCLVGGVAIDITDLRQAEISLRENEEFLKLSLDFTHIGSWDWHLDTNEVLWNENHARLLGLVPNEVKSSYQAWRDRVHPQDLDRVEQAVTNAIETHTDFEAEYRVLHPDGSLHWLIGRGRGIYDGSGCIARMIGAILDITDLKQAEQKIRTLNKILEQQNLELETLVEQRTAELLTLINTLPDYIFVIERKEMRFLFCNEQNARFSGFTTRQQMEGKTIFECFPPDLAADFAYQNQEVFESGETLHFQRSYPTPQGLLNLDTYKIPLKQPDGEVYALIGAARDISELVAARQAIANRTVQLEAANRELESFSYSVSHDLRAPLRHINGFVAALTNQLQQNGLLIDPKVAHYLQIIQESSQKMGCLVDGLLTLSRVGRRQLVDVPVNLNQLVQTALEQLEETAPDRSSSPARDRQFMQFVIGDLPTVLGDPTLLLQVFVNLLDNARKFSRDRRPAQIEIGTLADGTIFVRDNGVGFQMEYADQLFGAFQRLHSQSEFEGTGIGLAIVQRIIHRHGGTIWAESQPNQGTTFFLRIGNRPEEPGHSLKHDSQE